MKDGKPEPKRRYGVINFERRKYPRFTVDLPIEYDPLDPSAVHQGRASNASEGGLEIYFPEALQIGQLLRVKLFFSPGPELTTVEAVVEVVWRDLHLGEGWGDYRTGVKFVEVASEDLAKLKDFLKSLAA